MRVAFQFAGALAVAIRHCKRENIGKLEPLSNTNADADSNALADARAKSKSVRITRRKRRAKRES